jgi:hypothetical protein
MHFRDDGCFGVAYPASKLREQPFATWANGVKLLGFLFKISQCHHTCIKSVFTTAELVGKKRPIDVVLSLSQHCMLAKDTTRGA